MDRHTATQTLERYLSTTREFITLKNARTQVKKEPKTNALISQFQSKQSALYTQKLTSSQIQQVVNELDNEYQHLLSIPVIAQYFKAVDQFNAVLSHIMSEINTSLEQLMDQDNR